MLRFSYEWHRRLGVLMAVPIIIIALSGIILNHSGLFKLDTIFVTNSAILDWYGMRPSSEPSAIEWEGLAASSMEDLLYLNGKRIADNVGAPVGISGTSEQIIIATLNALVIVDRQRGAVVEILRRESLPPGNLLAVSVEDRELLLDSTAGQFRANFEELIFRTEARAPLMRQSVGKPLSPEMYKSMLYDWRSRGLSLWRLIIDLHSGRFFGGVGVFVVDLAGVSLLLLVCTGLYIWSQRK